ncbi:MAG: hypothetical protein FJX35_18175 [Alphaproteobacteria bacterium]|nr:hypothetical protein [Alphaproteobacteria bacterium]
MGKPENDLRTDAMVPIIDAHMHLWDLSSNYHPWLSDVPAPRMRHGDYTPLRHSYLPADHRRDSEGFSVIATVYVEAEWERDELGARGRVAPRHASRHGRPGLARPKVA